jgi:hypothetical protein
MSLFDKWLNLKCKFSGHIMSEIEDHHGFVKKFQCIRCEKYFAGVTFREQGRKYFRYMEWNAEWQHEAKQMDRMFEKFGE